MVRLITHNMLSCHVKNCNKDNFPLVFSEVELVVREVPENLDFLRRFLPKLDWPALVDTARSVSSAPTPPPRRTGPRWMAAELQLGDETLPEMQPEEMSDEQLKALHHVLMELHVEEGKMTCRGCGHVYPISNGIPNMLLAEHEVGR